MTSPFPGIDPYLEGQGRWPGFHASFMTYLADVITNLLPKSYEVEIDERRRWVMLIDEDGSSPDVVILDRDRASVGDVTTLEAVSVPLPRWVRSEIVERHLRITKQPGCALVTVLELLSPFDKTWGYCDYNANRMGYINQKIHLVELDLLLGGQRLPMGADLPPGDCYAFVSRADREGFSDVYAWNLRRPLPKLPIPLKAPDPDIKFDLGALYALAYERGRYARKLNYEGLPGVPLRAEDQTWIAERVREWKAAAPPQ